MNIYQGALNAIKKQNLTITDVVESSVKDPSIKEDLVSKNNEQIRSYQTVEDKKAQLKKTIVSFIADYQNDLNNHWKSPEETLNDGGGDCEDLATYFISLIGNEASLVKITSTTKVGPSIKGFV